MTFEGDDASVTVPSMTCESGAESETGGNLTKKLADPAGQSTFVQKRPATPKGKASKKPAAKGKVSKKLSAEGRVLKKPAAAGPCAV